VRAAPLWLALGAAALLSACGVSQVVDALAVPRPERLDSDPTETGLLIVDARLKHASSTFSFENELRLSEMEVRKVGVAKPVWQQSLRGRLAVFQLSPGTYELRALRGGMFKQHDGLAEAFLPREVGPIAIEVAAGQVAYVGRLTLTAHATPTRGRYTYSYEWDRDRAREAEALAFVDQAYKESPWKPILRQRLASLQRD
jgi:hypothetical protein